MTVHQQTLAEAGRAQASNLCDYLETIWRALKRGGIWVNEGPLLWFGNPELPLPRVL